MKAIVLTAALLACGCYGSEDVEPLDVPCPGSLWTCGCELADYEHSITLETCSAAPGTDPAYVEGGLEAVCRDLFGVECSCHDCVEW